MFEHYHLNNNNYDFYENLYILTKYIVELLMYILVIGIIIIFYINSTLYFLSTLTFIVLLTIIIYYFIEDYFTTNYSVKNI